MDDTNERKVLDDQERMLRALEHLNRRFLPSRAWYMAVTACQIAMLLIFVTIGVANNGVLGFAVGFMIGLALFALFFDKASPFFGNTYTVVVRDGELVLVKEKEGGSDSSNVSLRAKYNPRIFVLYVTTPGWFRRSHLRLNWASVPAAWTNWDHLAIAPDGTITLKLGDDGEEHKRHSLIEIVELMKKMTAPKS